MIYIALVIELEDDGVGKCEFSNIIIFSLVLTFLEIALIGLNWSFERPLYAVTLIGVSFLRIQVSQRREQWKTQMQNSRFLVWISLDHQCFSLKMFWSRTGILGKRWRVGIHVKFSRKIKGFMIRFLFLSLSHFKHDWKFFEFHIFFFWKFIWKLS